MSRKRADEPKLDLSEGRTLGGEYARQDLAIRRRVEREAVRRADSTHLQHGECWCIMEAGWLDKWAEFVRGGLPPGAICTGALVDANTGMPLPGLTLATDYRCVNPAVYALYEELWGTVAHTGPAAAPIARWVTDIYADAIDPAEGSRLLKQARLRARAEGHLQRGQFVEPPPPAADDDATIFSCGWCCDQCFICCSVLFRLITRPESRSQPSRAERAQYTQVEMLEEEDEEEVVVVEKER